MTALVRNRSLKFGVAENYEVYDVLTNVHIFTNAFVGHSGVGARGLIAGDTFLGVGLEEEDNRFSPTDPGTAGATGDKQIRVQREGVLYGVGVTGVTAMTDIDKPVYATDDQALTLIPSGTKIGKITKYISSGIADVYFCASDAVSVISGMSVGGNVTIATTGNTDLYVIAPISGIVQNVNFSGVDALAANDTNYITWSMTNLGQAGAGTTAIFAAATDASMTTKATGGTALAANTLRAMALSATLASRYVNAGDRILIRAAATGTLANTVTGSTYSISILPR